MEICESLDIDYLGTHFWVGIWLAVLTTVATALEVSCLLRHVSRFTQDIFAFLISCVFIYESLKKIYIVSSTANFPDFTWNLFLVVSRTVCRQSSKTFTLKIPEVYFVDSSLRERASFFLHV